jgi:hypothetical protein
MSPTQRSLKHLRDQGYVAEVVEKRLPHCYITKDLFGFIDILAIRGEETLAVQTTSGLNNAAARVRKIVDCAHLGAVRKANWRIVVHGWRKLKAGWELREIDVS